LAFDRDLVVVGGCGHVGLPLGILFADSGFRVGLYDINGATVERVNGGEMPFDEPGADEVLGQVRRNGRLEATTDPDVISTAENLVVVVGTPVDRYLNPEPEGVPRAIEAFGDRLRDGQLLVLRSTVYPGVTALVEKLVERMQRDIDVSFCPERIAEGRAMQELCSLPQIVSGRSPRAVRRATALFGRLAKEVIELSPEEAELAKLFTNTWRYIKFATANQLFMMANDFGLDFEHIRAAVTQHYPRAADMPGPGFAAGPCLFKDTMQLAAFNNNNFTLGHASVMINEGLPLYVVARMERRWNLGNQIVGILGTAFKGESDDTRSSLAYKLKRILKFKAGGVLATDPYVTTDPDLRPLEEVVERSDILVVGTPHRLYASLETDKPVVDIFGIRHQGVLV
jgi:UDP-N-acetyl-D-mannosaminuronic acid dehydrogenase